MQSRREIFGGQPAASADAEGLAKGGKSRLSNGQSGRHFVAAVRPAARATRRQRPHLPHPPPLATHRPPRRFSARSIPRACPGLRGKPLPRPRAVRVFGLPVFAPGPPPTQPQNPTPPPQPRQ